MACETVLIGYFPKQIVEADGVHAPAFAGVDEICSVSECQAKSPPDWVDRWAHDTETWLFDTPQAAWSVVPAAGRDRYRVHAYHLLPTLFHEAGRQTGHPLPALSATPVPDGFSRLGCDAVVRRLGWIDAAGAQHTPGFGCSPLSCNGLAAEYPVNRYCLTDDLDAAILLARRCAAGAGEPGPYCVVEVWGSEPSRRSRYDADGRYR